MLLTLEETIVDAGQDSIWSYRHWLTWERIGRVMRKLI